MEEQIAKFPAQFSWEPNIENAEELPANPTHFVLAGMGGSTLGGKLLLREAPLLPLTIHGDYGLPQLPPEILKRSLIIASSYSGETEETLDAAKAAVEAGLPVAVVTTGGALTAYAREKKLPLLQFTNPGVEPRMAVGYTMLALARLMKDTKLEATIRAVGNATQPAAYRTRGEELAARIENKIPFIYSSNQNAGSAYFFKIAVNETAKIPSASNAFPELCHNELCGFDVADGTRGIFSGMHAILLEDAEDHPRVRLRMKLMEELLEARSIASSRVTLEGSTGLEKALSGMLIGVWTAFTLAHRYGVPDAETPLIAEFKRRMAEHS